LKNSSSNLVTDPTDRRYIAEEQRKAMLALQPNGVNPMGEFLSRFLLQLYSVFF